MSVTESIIKNLQGLSQKELVQVASLVFRLNKSAQEEQARTFQELHGCLTDKEGEAFETALQGSRGFSSNA